MVKMVTCPALMDDSKAVLIPFLLEDVGGIPSLNQPDGIHPNVKGHRIVTENVWKIIGPMVTNNPKTLPTIVVP